MHTVERHRLGPEHVQNSTPKPDPTMGASGARALGGMFCNARVTHTAKLCTKHEQKKATVFFFRPTPDGSRQVVYQAGKTIAFCKFAELMRWQHQS